MSDETAEKKSRAPKSVVYLSLSKTFEKRVDDAITGIHARAPRLRPLVTKSAALAALSERVEKGLLQQDLETLLLHDLLGDMADLLKPAVPTRGGGQPVILDAVEESEVSEV